MPLFGSGAPRRETAIVLGNRRKRKQEEERARAAERASPSVNNARESIARGDLMQRRASSRFAYFTFHGEPRAKAQRRVRPIARVLKIFQLHRPGIKRPRIKFLFVEAAAGAAIPALSFSLSFSLFRSEHAKRRGNKALLKEQGHDTRIMQRARSIDSPSKEPARRRERGREREGERDR